MLEIEALSKRYGKAKPALDNISASFDSGIYGILGPNGAGKSTLLKIITLGLEPDKGIIKWDNEDINKLGARYRSILGYMPQQQGLYDGFTGFMFLNYICVLKNIDKNKIKDEICRVAKAVNLSDRLKDRLSSYSGGMKQRILLAASIIGDPKLLILDEPTVGFDPKERIRARELIGSMAEDRVIIVATHIVADIETIADEIMIMDKGHIAEKDTTAVLCEKYGHGEGLEGVYMHFFPAEDQP